MLTAIWKKNNSKVIARDMAKADGPFCCPKCGCETILHKGMVKVHHFAHKPPVICGYGKGESEFHRKCKVAIFDGLRQHPQIHDCELEKDFGRVVSDVFFIINGVKIAVEVQISNLTMERIIERTKEYNNLGINVIWLPVFASGLNEDLYAPNQWEKWLHATYYGRVYYWVGGLSVQAVHFDEHQHYVESTFWYNEYGEEESGGGYFRRSKRYKVPNLGPIFNLIEDFEPRVRSAWCGGTISVPACRLFIDRHKPWWVS